MIFVSGTDHQRIAKLDRENEVAPPSKIAPSVGRVRLPYFFLRFFLTQLINDIGYSDCPCRTQIFAKGGSPEDQ
jgi:Multiprotein bridging factor 1